MAAEKSKMKTSFQTNLPIEKFRSDILKAVENNLCLVIIGETGSGKTTQLPQFLYKAGYGKHGLIGITQPRRVAAVSVASRVAEEMRCEVGEKVGYQVRFDDCTSQETRIKYMTDGCLLREFLEDRELSKYSVIVLDEAHERSLDTDILFGLMKELFINNKINSKRKYSLKVIVMSATLDAGRFSAFFNDCEIINIPGRLYPVKSIYCNLINEEDVKNPHYASKVVDVVMDIHLDQTQGDILVFLTGQAEIEKACDALFKKSERLDYEYDVHDSSVKALLILPVYGSMPTEIQKRIFSPADPWVRKCVVATNIAGTSLTIDGIRYVVDCGFVKQFHYLDPPEERMLLEALRQLYYFEAINKDGCITGLGHHMVDYPLPPGLSRSVIYSGMLGCSDVMLPIAAMLSVESVFIRPGDEKKQVAATNCHRTLGEIAGGVNDFATLLYIYQQCNSSDSPARWCRDHYIHWRAVKMASSICQQLQEILKRQTESSSFQKITSTGSESEKLRKALCCGYFCNAARKRTVGRGFQTMDGHGTGVFIHPSSLLFDKEEDLDWLIFYEVVWTSKVYIRTVCPIRYEWVKNLLPRLHELDVYALSGCLKMINKETSEKTNDTIEMNLTAENVSSALKVSRRNTDSSIAEARRRYLERKQMQLSGNQ
ncbi:putative ATP-dependent RNA helicase DHX40 [Saccoglossus kowalevskii]|uniref:RNA helicase n=1 Tax=Saccoglossus kowalevskii TaxID=10224 RepID=A0ABM0GMR6_SACKO|nr:PREDICTED: probable ATP-dependent RNA helicase DHX40-like [Saccoglossus kowalevskii]